MGIQSTWQRGPKGQNAVQKMGLKQQEQQMKGWGATSSGAAVFLQGGRQGISTKYKDKIGGND